MIETRIPIVPDTSTTLTDETTEHIVNRKVTIKIDRDYLKKEVCRTIRATGKSCRKISLYSEKTTCKKTGARSCKKTGWTILLITGK